MFAVLLGAQLGCQQDQSAKTDDAVASEAPSADEKPSIAHLHAYKAWHHTIYLKVTAAEAGTVKRVTADDITVDNRIYDLRKFVGLSPRTCLNQKPIVEEGQRVKKGEVIADGAATPSVSVAIGRA